VSEHEGFVGGVAPAFCQTSETTTGGLLAAALLAVNTYDLPPELFDVAPHVVDWLGQPIHV
jgi:hypothetical protein